MIIITTTNYLLGAGAIVSAIFTFYTGTLGVIWNLATTSYQAFIFLVGFLFILSAPILNAFSRKKFLDVHGRNLMLVLILVLLVEPYVIQGVYNPSELAVYGDADSTIADHVTKFNYYNGTTLENVWNSAPTETAAGNGTWTVDWGLAATTTQDEDKAAFVTVYWSTTGTVSDTWNITAFLDSTDDYIVAVGFRIQTPTLGKAFTYNMGFQTDGDYWKGTCYSSSSLLTMIYMDSLDQEWFDEYLTLLADDHFALSFIESDADEFTDTNEIEIEVHFYTSMDMSRFDEYLLYCGFLNLLLGLAITKYWNPTGTRRSYRRRWRTTYRPRFRRYRRRYGRRYNRRRRFRRYRRRY